MHDDYVCRWPQSGEVIAAVPTGGPLRRTTQTPKRYVFTRIASSAPTTTYSRIFSPLPTWNFIHLEGSGDELNATGTITYPNGETWQFVTLFTMREGKIWRQVDYFALPLESPDWRAPTSSWSPGQSRDARRPTR